MTPVEDGVAPCLIHIDKEGTWFHKGVEMIRREFVRSFFQQMELDAVGQYIISWGGKRCYVDVADTAFVVRRVSPAKEETGKGPGFVLALSDDTEEALVPNTLYMGKENVLYCRVKGGGFPARFNRAAYYQLAAYIEAEGEDYVLPINGRKFKIAPGDPQNA